MTMREIDVSRITDAIARMCISANLNLPKDVQEALLSARKNEDGTVAQEILDRIIENYQLAGKEQVPICQDTGMACVFLEVGQEVHLTGGSLYEAVHEGVRRGYVGGYLRKSVEVDPVRRGNTNDNTPAMITTDIVPGDRVRITVAPKGFGSENMSALKMLKPSQGLSGIKDFILETVENAGSNPCPPIIVGVGIGGNLLIRITRIRFMLLWRTSCFRRSMNSGSGRRDSEEGQRHLQSTSRRFPRTLPGCPARSISAVM